MRILITGADGQLGTELQRILLEGQAEIGPIPDIYLDAEVTAVTHADLDIANESAVDVFVGSSGCDLVINCASMTNVDACENKEDLAYNVNARGAGNLAIAAQACGAKFVQVSTDYVFAGEVYADRTEDDLTDPQSAYGRTKLAGERLALENCDRTFVVRTAWLYGYRGSNFVKTMLRLARQQGTIKVVYDQFGNPTSANDLAHELLRIAATEDYGIYHCTGKGTCSWCDFACAIVDGAGISCTKIPCTTEEFPRPAKRPAYSSLRNKRLEDTIGDEMRPWHDALAMYLSRLPELDNEPLGREPI